ncbi:phosphatidylglycerophosphate phosphatase PTPMT1-like [Prosopis cineraria]|uniref:phosphatidylglycerophosphate phosphatase PTPMT1-like n=1 Tax=Prosopis cineraria TaxID=364024 RepID=UPI00240F78B8|nr:phosphatidylglycerophosphate phosphatase PTPMT1-like [Prosopis cineraria]
MKGEEVKGEQEEQLYLEDRDIGRRSLVVSDVKRVLVGAGARALFYPTLLYNVLRNRFQAEFRWWDKVDEFILLGAVPFPIDVPRLKELGVCGVITLNESYETLVPTTLYHAHGIEHLVIPTRDYCFAPSLRDICRAVDFLHENASSGRSTYVHCKAGRGRSTTIVICYLVHYQMMTPDDAYDYVKSIRPRVLLASSQWQAVQEYYHIMVKNTISYLPTANLLLRPSQASASASKDLVKFDDDGSVVVTESDLEGYDPRIQPSGVRREIWADLSFAYHVRVAGQAALTGMSWLRLRCVSKPRKMKGRGNSSSFTSDHLGGISVDIHVY